MLVVIKQQLLEKINHELLLAKTVAIGNGAMKKYADGMAAALRNLKNDVETMDSYDVYINNTEKGKS